jgi:hypothetical protein
MFAHERSLVQKYEGKPFALLGVNTFDSPKELRELQRKERLNWRSWCDGPGGPIVKQWQVEGLPTLYLIDHKGIIRWESVGVPNQKKLEARIEQLVAEASGRKKS